MKKKLCIIVNLLFCVISLFALNIQGSYEGNFNPTVGDTKQTVSYGFLDFKDAAYEMSVIARKPDKARQEIPEMYFDRDYYNEDGTYSIVHEGVSDCLILKGTAVWQYKTKLGILFHPRRLFLYDKNELFFGSDEGIRWAGLNPKVINITSSSFLAENDVKYDGSNFRRPEKYAIKPWVEGINGDGIGEWIALTIEKVEFPLNLFLISNGFVSFTNPSLYERNNRIKKLRILCESEEIDFTVTLDDTPQFQEILLPRSITSDYYTFKFIVEDVYKGTKWDDTCLNVIIPLGNLPN